jgi:HEAT repeat protein
MKKLLLFCLAAAVLAGCRTGGAQGRIQRFERSDPTKAYELGIAVELLLSTELSDRLEAEQTLASAGKPGVWYLTRALDSKWEIARFHAARALGRTRRREAVDPLVRALGDSSWDVRFNAAAALKDLGRRSVKALTRVLRKKKGPRVRSLACWALGAIGDSKAAKYLIRAFRDRSGQVRSYAVEALVRMGNLRTVERLVRALREKHPCIRTHALSALRRITRLDLGEDYDAWKRWFDGEKKKQERLGQQAVTVKGWETGAAVSD